MAGVIWFVLGMLTGATTLMVVALCMVDKGEDDDYVGRRE